MRQHPTPHERNVGYVLGLPIDALTWRQATGRIIEWAQCRASRYVTLCNVHVTVTASRNRRYGRLIESADLTLPDGAPVAWMLRCQGFRRQARMPGPDLMWRLLKTCAGTGVGIYLYGSTETVLSRLRDRLEAQFPGLQIAGMTAPPFHPLNETEDRAVVRQINASGAGIIFVGLGCPKQEHWMANHRGRVKGVMIGVGAAFDFHSGTLARAPKWMRSMGLEWLHRFSMEPRRLWMRYLSTNTQFLILALRNLTTARGKKQSEFHQKNH